MWIMSFKWEICENMYIFGRTYSPDLSPTPESFNDIPFHSLLNPSSDWAYTYIWRTICVPCAHVWWRMRACPERTTRTHKFYFSQVRLADCNLLRWIITSSTFVTSRLLAGPLSWFAAQMFIKLNGMNVMSPHLHGNRVYPRKSVN